MAWFNFTFHPVGDLGIGVKSSSLNRMTTNPLGPLYGPGQSSGGHTVPSMPGSGLNRRDIILQSSVSPVSHDPTVNSLLGNGAYQHGTITVQDLLNVQAATGSYNPG